MALRERRDGDSRAGLVTRIRSEFAEMPELRLDCEQASRFWALRADICARVLAVLEGDGLLRRGDDGTYCRSDLGA